MALTNGFQLPFGIQPLNPVPTDAWSGPYEGVTEVLAKAAANSSIPAGVRFKSMEVRLLINGTPKKYWYRDGTTDSDLVEYLSVLTDYVSTNFFPLSGGTITGNTKIQGNVTVYGDISSTGDSYFANTIYSTTSALSVVNVGNTGPAVYVGNNGSGDLASFYDLDSNIEVFHIGGANGSFPNVGVKTSFPNTDLTVNGEISSNSVIYDGLGNSNQWNSVYTSVKDTSANWDSVYTSVSNTSANWDSVYTSVKDTSANWDSVYSSVLNTSANWDSVYSSVLNTSANWDSVYTNVNSTSATFATYDSVDSNFLNLTGGIIDGNLSVLSSFEVGNGDTILFVSGGKVGINTELPNTELTVNGSISSNGVIYDLLGNSNQWNSVYTNLNSNSANSNSVYTSVNLVSANWDSVYTSVLNTSANWDSTFTSVRNTSANWDSVYTNVSSYSATYATYNYVDSNFLNLTGGVINGNVSVLSSFEVGSGSTVLFVSGGKVGINTELPTVELTVSGSISASNKIYGTIIDWMTLTRGFKIEPVFNSTIAGGDVYTYVYESSPSDKTYYRYIATDGSEDAYYGTFSGGILSNLIAKKKIIV
jgi:hypothetical protein